MSRTKSVKDCNPLATFFPRPGPGARSDAATALEFPLVGRPRKIALIPDAIEPARPQVAVDVDWFRRMLRRVGLECELPLVHPHQLRHSCGYALADKGRDLREIQLQLGHKSISNTVGYVCRGQPSLVPAKAPEEARRNWLIRHMCRFCRRLNLHATKSPARERFDHPGARHL